MGEYAKRKSDGEEVKIGTCESMYYLRYEDKNNVEPCEGSGYGIYYRLPFPDEDDVDIGNYENYNRGYPLYDTVNDYTEYFTDPTTADDPGIIQITHKCGLLINIPCYHGAKLPDGGEEIKVFWNGKSNFLELSSLKECENGEIRPVIKCKHCGHMWSYDWADVLPYIQKRMKQRLMKYVKE